MYIVGSVPHPPVQAPRDHLPAPSPGCTLSLSPPSEVPAKSVQPAATPPGESHETAPAPSTLISAHHLSEHKPAPSYFTPRPAHCLDSTPPARTAHSALLHARCLERIELTPPTPLPDPPPPLVYLGDSPAPFKGCQEQHLSLPADM